MNDSGPEKLSPRAKAMRAHREIFEYARAHGLTLAAAEAELVRQRWAASQARLAQVRRCGRVIPQDKSGASAGSEQTGLGEGLRPIPADAPWMMRD